MSTKSPLSLLPGFAGGGEEGTEKELAKLERERGAWVGAWTLETLADGRPGGAPGGDPVRAQAQVPRPTLSRGLLPGPGQRHRTGRRSKLRLRQ